MQQTAQPVHSQCKKGCGGGSYCEHGKVSSQCKQGCCGKQPLADVLATAGAVAKEAAGAVAKESMPKKGKTDTGKAPTMDVLAVSVQRKVSTPCAPTGAGCAPAGAGWGGGDTSLIISRSCSGAAVLEFIITPLGACPRTFLFLFSVLTPVRHAHSSRRMAALATRHGSPLCMQGACDTHLLVTGHQGSVRGVRGAVCLRPICKGESGSGHWCTGT